jgi:hypothetical protein
VAPPILELNDVSYVLTPFDKSGILIRREDDEDFTARFSQGQQTLSDVHGFLPIRFPNFSLGLGRFRIDSDSATNPDEYRRFFDAIADTRWASGGYGPIQEEDSTHTGLEVVRVSALFKGDLWTIWDDDSSDDVVARKYTGSTTTWEGGGTVRDAAGGPDLVGQDLMPQKTHLLCFVVRGARHEIYRSTDGVTWSGATTQPTTDLFTNSVTANEDIDGGLLADIGGEAVLIAWHENSAQITFFSSTDAGDNWTDEAVDIPTGNGPQGAAVMAGIDNEDKLYVGTREGLYEVDTAPGTWTFRLIFPMVPNNDNCVLPGNRVSANGIKNASSVFYKGPALEFLTKGGHKLSVTPKHPILTNRGWVFAQDIRPSDKLVCAVGQDKGVSFADKDVTNAPPMIEEIFSSLNEVGLPARHDARVTDFHGDGRFMDGNVDIVGADGKLRCSCDMSSLEPIHEQALCGSYEDPHVLTSLRTLGEIGDTSLGAPQGVIHRFSGNPPLFGSQFSQTDPHGGALTTLDIGLTENALDDPDAKRIIGSDTLRTLPSEIALDDIIGIRHFNFSGHVYDLQTTDELYTASGVVVHNCRRMKVHSDGALWFAQGVDDDSPPTVYRMSTSDGRRRFEVVPNDFSLGDGVVAEASGPIRWMASEGKMLYASAGGGKAGRNARIWCHNGNGWHTVRRHGTENQKIEWIAASGDDDGTPRLHYAVRTSAAVSDANFLAQAFVNPSSGVAIKREATGYIDLPYVDGGFGLDTKNFLRIGINAAELSATNSGDYINVDRGITTDLGSLVARNASDVGDFLSGTSRISLGTNGVGIAGRVIGLRVNIITDTAGNTTLPTLKDVQIDATVNITKKDRYEFLVDLDKSAKMGATERRTTEVLADLNTARISDVLVPIVYADLTTDYVKVLDVSYSEQYDSEGTQGSDVNVTRRGTARVLVSEVL